MINAGMRACVLAMNEKVVLMQGFVDG